MRKVLTQNQLRFKDKKAAFVKRLPVIVFMTCSSVSAAFALYVMVKH